MAIAVTAANDFDPKDLEQLHWARDMKTEAYQRVFKQLNDVRNKNPEVKYAYLMRPTETKDMYEFIADADSNYNLPQLWVDFDKNGSLDNSDINVWPGFRYYDQTLLFSRAMKKPSFGKTLDQWGYFITGMAPIYDLNRNVVGLLGFDMDAQADLLR